MSDPLTGLNGRHHFREQLEGTLARSTEQHEVCVLLIDVDHFKNVNASYGQSAGDTLLRQIAERIRCCISSPHLLARMGSDEFAVIIHKDDGDAETEAQACCEKLIQCMNRPFPVADGVVEMHVSMGLVLNTRSESTVDSMLANADVAMRIAKLEPGSTYQFFTKDMTLAAQKVLRLETEIRQGLNKEEFQLYYQPRVDLRQNRIVGAEALIRWNHPEHGLTSPREFIGIAEDSGLIVPLGYWVIHSACEHLNELAAQGHEDVQIAVNVAFRQFQDRGFVSTVASILEHYGISPGRLEFELTETTMMIEGQAVDQSLRRLSELGIDISLDDFGTGYSSFAHIQRLPISALKIDRSFVSSVCSNEDDATIVRAMINLAHSLSIQVIAEGAETMEQLEFLCINRCDQVQGFYFSRPVPFSELLAMLADENYVDQHIQAMIEKRGR